MTELLRNELDRLQTEHASLETRLSELDQHAYLTPDEQIERKQIQKLKLLLKDRMTRLRPQA